MGSGEHRSREASRRAPRRHRTPRVRPRPPRQSEGASPRCGDENLGTPPCIGPRAATFLLTLFQTRRRTPARLTSPPPLSERPQSATAKYDLPSPAVAVRNLLARLPACRCRPLRPFLARVSSSSRAGAPPSRAPAPAPAAAQEQARYGHLCTIMSRLHHRRAGYPFGALLFLSTLCAPPRCTTCGARGTREGRSPGGHTACALRRAAWRRRAGLVACDGGRRRARPPRVRQAPSWTSSRTPPATRSSP